MRFSYSFKLMLSSLLAAWLVIAPATATGISITEEESLGRDFARMVEQQYQVIKDPFVVSYINRLGKRILSAFPPQPFVYRFNVVEEEVYNAFAGPGGNVYFNSGLIVALEHEDALAGIVAHEIGHVDSRHISERIERSKKINAAMMAGMVASIFLGGAGAATAANALGVGSVAAGQSATLAYTRKDEIEADKKGLQYMVDAGYSKAGLLAALNTIRSKQWFGREHVPTYLMTHPALEDRLAYIGAEVDQGARNLDWQSRRVPEYQIVRARLLALYSDPETGLLSLQGAVGRNPNDPFSQYGLGLALLRKGASGEAIGHLETASVMLPAWPIIRSDLGAAYFQVGRYDDARNVLQAVLDQTPDDANAGFYLGRALLEAGYLGEAVQQLEAIAATDPLNSDAQYYLGEAQHKLGNAAQAHFHLGVASYIRRNARSAVFHLERALAAGLPAEQAEDAEKMLERLSEGKRKVLP